ncbi:MAG: hypothetical protein QOH88_791 [Verrucomicrobiota bacterium]|jgi:hypothetical protein
MSTLTFSVVVRRISLTALFMLATCLAAYAADSANWTGEYTDKNFLGGSAVFQLGIAQSGGGWQVTFDAAHKDAHGAAPEAEGPGKISGNTLEFKWTDTFSNSGTGTITRAGDDIVVSLKPTKVVEPRCLVFYKQNMRLKRASKK